VSKLQTLVKSLLKINYNYIFTRIDEPVFNQSIAKNRGTEIAKNDILLYINSDILLQDNALLTVSNVFDVARTDKLFVMCARHDIFITNSLIENFSALIHDNNNYSYGVFKIQEPGWHYLLKNPKVDIEFDAKYFSSLQSYCIVLPDFMSGNLIFGDFFAIKRSTWERFKFDESVLAATDIFLQSLIFTEDDTYMMSFVQQYTSCFHLSGSDYRGQDISGNPKATRMYKDVLHITENYDKLRYWLVFGYKKEYDELIKKYNINVGYLVNTYFNAHKWKYLSDKEHFCKTYGVTEI
jgi:hypothetical protein